MSILQPIEGEEDVKKEKENKTVVDDEEEENTENLINIQDDYDDEKENEMISIQLKESLIQADFSQLCKYSPIIRGTYLFRNAGERLSSEFQLYQEKYKIKESNIIQFIKLIQEENIVLNNESYFDLYKLSKIFKVNVLIKILRRYSKSHNQDIGYLVNLMLEQKTSANSDVLNSEDVSLEVERCLADQINNCFKDESFAKLQIPIIYRIVEKSDKNKLKSVEKRCVLFYFIDIKKMSKTKLNDLYNRIFEQDNSNLQKFFRFFPFNIEYLKMIKNENDQMKEDIETMLIEYNNLDEQYRFDRINELNRKKNNLHKKYFKIFETFLSDDEILNKKSDDGILNFF